MTREELIKKTSLADVVNVECMLNLGSYAREKLRKANSLIAVEMDNSWYEVVKALDGLNNKEFDETIYNLQLNPDVIESGYISLFLNDCHN